MKRIHDVRLNVHKGVDVTHQGTTIAATISTSAMDQMTPQK